VSFGKGGKATTEDEAKAKATKLLADIRGGADFVKLVKENSDDETSKAKDGDFATLRRTDNIPDAIRAAVFSLKQGEVSEPVRQPNGFYLLRADEVRYRPLSQVSRRDLHGLETAALQPVARSDQQGYESGIHQPGVPGRRAGAPQVGAGQLVRAQPDARPQARPKSGLASAQGAGVPAPYLIAT